MNFYWPPYRFVDLFSSVAIPFFTLPVLNVKQTYSHFTKKKKKKKKKQVVGSVTRKNRSLLRSSNKLYRQRIYQIVISSH